MEPVNGFPVGLLNCVEAEYPELSRIVALQGAKLIVMPTAADFYYKLASTSMCGVVVCGVVKAACMRPNLVGWCSDGSWVLVPYPGSCGGWVVAGVLSSNALPFRCDTPIAPCSRLRKLHFRCMYERMVVDVKR